MKRQDLRLIFYTAVFLGLLIFVIVLELTYRAGKLWLFTDH